jgi:hypothetical protein
MHLMDVQSREERREVVEIPMSRRKAIAKILQPLPGKFERVLISINTNQPPGRAQPLQNGLAMSAPPKRGVDIDPLWIVQKVVENFAQENRCMIWGDRHGSCILLQHRLRNGFIGCGLVVHILFVDFGIPDFDSFEDAEN